MNKIVLIGKPRRALEVLAQEMEKRIGPGIIDRGEAAAQDSFILLGTAQELNRWQDVLDRQKEPGAEGFRICVVQDSPLQVIACGADERGCLYACGYLLRKLELRPGSIRMSKTMRDCSVTPADPMRGHQLAYRDKQNTLPAWTAEEFDHYIRTLALSGANAIEILPPRTDDRLFSPLFKLHPLEMMTRLSEIIHSYGLDVWIWYPNMAEDYSDPETFRREIEEREQVFSALPYLEGILIPSGDPGELPPKQFFGVTEKMMAVAHRYHPEAKVYVAPQCFSPTYDWYEGFYSEVAREPEWLYGVCFAAWVRDTLPELAARIPEKYRNRIRLYMDITHTASSQFEVPHWDGPLALIHGRESCCPRPKAMQAIHRLHDDLSMGCITYSEGIHDDLNKFVWTCLDMEPSADLQEIVEDYVRMMISPDSVTELASLLFALEDNWKGKTAENTALETTFARFEALDSGLSAEIRGNWRYKMLYQRAMLDAYIRRRYLADQALETQARACLQKAPECGADQAIRAARAVLNRTWNEPAAEELRFRLQALSQELFQTPDCRIQQSTVLHNAQKWIRGAWLDTLNMPLNDTQFLTCHFKRILALTDEGEKLAALDALLHRTDAGEGGRYIDLGSIDDFDRYVVSDIPWEEDSGRLRSPHLFHDLYGLMMRFHGSRGWHDEYPIPLCWVHRARTIYGTPLKVRVDGLEPNAHYILQATYPDMIEPHQDVMKVYLFANGQLIHDEIHKDDACLHEPIYRYELTAPADQEGVLELVWKAYDECYPTAVSELWLTRV